MADTNQHPTDLYPKLLDILLVLRDTAEFFRVYSASDLKDLIEASLHNKKKMPEGIRRLYDLERRIAEVQALITKQRE